MRRDERCAKILGYVGGIPIACAVVKILLAAPLREMTERVLVVNFRRLGEDDIGPRQPIFILSSPQISVHPNTRASGGRLRSSHRRITVHGME